MKKQWMLLLAGTCLTVSLVSGCGQKTDTMVQEQTGTTTQNNTAGGQASSGTTAQNSTAGITEEEAKNIALTRAGITEADTIGLVVTQDFDDGMTLYDVDIYTPSMDYEYDINTVDGTVVKEDRSVPPQVTADPGTSITSAKAKELILSKVAGAGEQNLRMKVDYDDGRTCYEGEVIYNNMSYEFELDAQTGAILEWSEETLGF